MPAGFSDNTDNVDDADNDPTNELQNWGNLPGIPANIDTDATDDFSGAWTDLTGVPVNLDTDATDDFSGAWSDLTSVPAGFSDNIDNVNDADADPTNELQNWSNLPGIPANIDIDVTDDFDGSSLNNIGNVNISVLGNNDFIVWKSASGEWQNRNAASIGLSTIGHTHAASDITSGTFVDARISQSSVTQHEGALTITESQISDLNHFSGSWNDLTSVPAGFSDGTDDNTNIANANLSSNANRTVDFNNNSLTFTETDFNLDGFLFSVDQTVVDVVANSTSTSAIDILAPNGGVNIDANNFISIDANDIRITGDSYDTAVEGYLPTLDANKVIKWVSPNAALSDELKVNWSVLTNTLDGTETINFQGRGGGLIRLPIGAVTTTNITFSNGVVGATYSCWFYGGSSELTINWPANTYNSANQVAPDSTVPAGEGKHFVFLFDGTNYLMTNE